MRTRALTVGTTIAGTLLLASGACMPTMACRNTIIADIPAPAGAHHAVLFDRDCGATTRGSAQVSVLARGEMPEAAGNVFGADVAFGPELSPRLGQPLVVRVARCADARDSLR